MCPGKTENGVPYDDNLKWSLVSCVGGCFMYSERKSGLGESSAVYQACSS